MTTKIHLLCDGAGRPLACTLTEGQRHEATQTEALLDGVRVAGLAGAPRRRFEAIAGDKGYDARRVREAIERRGGRPVIPRRGRAIAAQDGGFDRAAYRRRNVVERLVGRLKESRAVATRYEKLAACYHAFVHLACILLWLKEPFLNRA